MIFFQNGHAIRHILPCTGAGSIAKRWITRYSRHISGLQVVLGAFNSLPPLIYSLAPARELAILFLAGRLMPCVGAQPHTLIISSVSTPHLSCFSRTLALNHTRRLCISCKYIIYLLFDLFAHFPSTFVDIPSLAALCIPRSKPTFSILNIVRQLCKPASLMKL
jgi:hypothetical protein